MTSTTTKRKAPKVDIAAEVTDRIIASLEEGTVPWRRPWTVKAGDNHRNYVTNKPYRGINPFMLDLQAMVSGYSSGQWLTFKQAQAQSYRQYCKDNGLPITKDGKPNPDSDKAYRAAIKEDADTYRGVKKGEKGTRVVYWHRYTFTPNDADGNPVTDKDGNLKRVPGAKPIPHTVFNVEQTGLPAESIDEEGETREHTQHEDSEAVIARLKDEEGLMLSHGGTGAYYTPALDTVTMPDPETFHSDEGYYHTLYHEITHWTKHESRLNRKEPNHGGFGTEGYAREELTAELGAAIVTHTLGIGNTELHDQEAAYIASWLKALKNDKGLILRAGSKAQAAADYIMGIKYEDKGEDN